jgi:hypothetical protein
MEERFFRFTNSNGLRLAGLLRLPSGVCRPPLIVACHGFLSSKNSLTNNLLADRLERDGLACFRFDFSGHGDSEGDLSEISLARGVDDLKSALETVIGQRVIDEARIGLFGSSFGGNVVLWHIARDERIMAAALKAPVSDLAALLEKQAGSDRIREWRERGWAEIGDLAAPNSRTYRFDYTLYAGARALDTYELAARIRCPVLIIHGDQDEVVPLEQSVRLAERIGQGARLSVMAGAGHTFANEGELQGVIEQAAGHLGQGLRDWQRSDHSHL